MATVHKNYYEELIDQMMIDEILNEDVRKLLSNITDIKKKRIAILSALEDNNKQKALLFGKIKKLLFNTKVSATEHIKEVVTMLREYVQVGDVEKKKFGEVMTPISLVEEMLDTLPVDVWSNSDLKWLDPANGVGIFPCVVVERLMEGLKEWEPNEEKRYIHIMENMIYICELQPKNMFLYLCAFDPLDYIDLNIHCGSFLEDDFDKHMKDVYGVEKFDVVIMNPPYNGDSSNRVYTLWDKFVNKSITQKLKLDAYLVAVHPDGWRTINKVFDDTREILINHEMIYLEMHNTADGHETFGVNTNYDYYCIKNKKTENFITKIKTYNEKIEYHNINKFPFIPNNNILETLSLVAKEGEEKVNLLYACSMYHTQKLKQMSKVQTDEFKYPCAYTVGAKNPNFWYSNIKLGFFVPKVIWGNGLSDVIVDEDGKYGLTQFAYGIEDELKNLKLIQKVLKSEKFKKDVMGYTKGVGHIYNRKIIALFRKDFWKEFVDEETGELK